MEINELSIGGSRGDDPTIGSGVGLGQAGRRGRNFTGWDHAFAFRGPCTSSSEMRQGEDPAHTAPAVAVPCANAGRSADDRTRADSLAATAAEPKRNGTKREDAMSI